jgi:hypothetical protein
MLFRFRFVLQLRIYDVSNVHGGNDAESVP